MPPSKISHIRGKLSYRFSDRINLEGTINQIAVGHNFGDFFV